MEKLIINTFLQMIGVLVLHTALAVGLGHEGYAFAVTGLITEGSNKLNETLNYLAYKTSNTVKTENTSDVANQL